MKVFLFQLVLLLVFFTFSVQAQDDATVSLWKLWNAAGQATNSAIFHAQCQAFLNASTAYLRTNVDDTAIWTLTTRAATELGDVTEITNAVAQMHRLHLDQSYEPVYWDTLRHADRLLKKIEAIRAKWTYPTNLPINDIAVTNVVSARIPLSYAQLSDSARFDFSKLDRRMRKLPTVWEEIEATDILTAIKKFNLANPNYPRGWQMQMQLSLILNREIERLIAVKNLTDLGQF